MATRAHLSKVESNVPYSLMARRERSRELAQKRRTTYKTIMSDLAQELPFSRDVVSQVDYNSRLRLALCFFKMKNLVEAQGTKEPLEYDIDSQGSKVEYDTNSKPTLLKPGMLQDLMTEALDGFLVVTVSDGTIVYVSESIHKHLGLFQSEHIGYSIYDLILEEDHEEVKSTIAKSEAIALSRVATQCSFFCRMKCSRFKVANTATKSPGYKLVFVSGSFKAHGSDPFLTAIVRPVSPPSILEIRMEGNMFVTHYTLDFHCTFFDGRLRHLLGYNKNDLVGLVPFALHHHDDTEATMECAKGVMTKGEGLSGYYRYMTQFGHYIWVQSRATLMFDSRSGKPSYIVCMNFVINKEKGERDLTLRQAITAGESSLSEVGNRSHDPFPIPRPDGKEANPLEGEVVKEEVKPAVHIEEPTSTISRLTPPVSDTVSTSSSPDLGYVSPTSSPPLLAPTYTYPTPPSSTASSPDNCLPDSTTSTSLFTSGMGTEPHTGLGTRSGITSISSSTTDLGYQSISSEDALNKRLGIFSPNMDSVSSRDPDIVSPYSYDVFTPSPVGQKSADNPPSVFSSEGSVTQTQNQSQTPLHYGRGTVQATAQQSRTTPIQTTSCPNSIPATTASSCSGGASSYSYPGPVNEFEIPELKYRPGSHGDYASFQTRQCSYTPPSTQQQQQPQQPWNPEMLPTFVKQEPPDFSYGAANITGGVNFFPEGNARPMPRAPNHTPMDVTSSIIIIGDTNSSASYGQAMPPQPGLPVLTGDDLKVLDFINQLEEGNIRQLPHYSR